MAQKQYIKYLYEAEDKSLRESTRITGHSFKTVRKYAYQTNWSEDSLPDTRPKHHPVPGPYIHLNNIGCRDSEIAGIVSSCGYLCKSVSDINKLFHTLNSYGFTDLADLFFANPLILDPDGFEIDYIKHRKECGATESRPLQQLSVAVCFISVPAART